MLKLEFKTFNDDDQYFKELVKDYRQRNFCENNVTFISCKTFYNKVIINVLPYKF